MTNSNFIVKVSDAKVGDIQKALQNAGITVRSVLEVFREEEKPKEEKETQ